MEDDRNQAKAAQNILAEAERVALPMPALCELSWVLGAGYRLTKSEIAQAIDGLASARNAVVDDGALEAGQAMLAAGGDFADGVIAYVGRWMRADTFASFDKKAIKLLKAQGFETIVPR